MTGKLPLDRRLFLRIAGGAAAATAATALSSSVARAASVAPAAAAGTIEDVEHIVILMQENRSFDHYYGSMRGVRGFFDHLVPPVLASDPGGAGSTVPVTGEWYDFPESVNTYPPGWYGLGPRVPMLVVSPWSRGGWVNSESFDHTSLNPLTARLTGWHPGSGRGRLVSRT